MEVQQSRWRLAVLVSCATVVAFPLTSWISFRKFSTDVRFHEERRRFAVLIAGTLRRFNSNADTHLVAPLTRENWDVDVFLSLFDGPSHGWRSISDAFQQDPQFDGLNRSGIQSVIERRFSMPGSRLVVNKVFDEYHGASEDIAFVDRNQFWRNKHRAGDGKTARSNFILLLKELESLWYQALLQEHLLGAYSYVMILRDDAFWFQDFNLNRLLDLGGVERTAASSTNKGHLYSMLCKNIPDPFGIIDYVFLLDRSAAETFGKCYSRLAHPAHFGKEWLAKYEHNQAGDMSERFYLILANFTEIQVIDVPTSLLPMQRTARLDGRMCLHKYCDSDLKSKTVGGLKPDMPLCKPKKGSFSSSFGKIPFGKSSKDARFHKKPRVARFALLIAGTLRRFNSNADTHVVAPLIGENWEVDVFLSLFDGPSRGWTSVSDNFQQDPQFDGLNRSGIQSAIERRFSMPGSRLVVNKVFDDHHQAPEDVAFVKRNVLWPERRPGHGRFARSNFILLLKELESLWYQALLQEHLLGAYSYVMILRDDAFWFQDFNLNRLLDLGGVERTAASSTNKGHLYSMLCKNIPDPIAIIDYVFLLDRSAAETFGKCYSRLAHPAHFGKEWLAKYEHNKVGDGSEHFYFTLANFTEIQVIDVPTSLLPMQRTARLDGRMCLHKYCDSDVKSKDVQQRKPDMPLCKKLNGGT
eukprot:Skav232532  [mRNA]  locus=scaffold319:65619:67703:+ [translate_table: standard]